MEKLFQSSDEIAYLPLCYYWNLYTGYSGLYGWGPFGNSFIPITTVIDIEPFTATVFSRFSLFRINAIRLTFSKEYDTGTYSSFRVHFLPSGENNYLSNSQTQNELLWPGKFVSPQDYKTELIFDTSNLDVDPFSEWTSTTDLTTSAGFKIYQNSLNPITTIPTLPLYVRFKFEFEFKFPK